jgi:hypothetical protein
MANLRMQKTKRQDLEKSCLFVSGFYSRHMDMFEAEARRIILLS